jgi:hypothetical protein
MLTRLAGGTGPAAVAGCYEGLIDALVLDEQDAPGGAAALTLGAGIRPVVAKTLMRDDDARRRLVQAVLDAAAAVA